MIVHVTNCIITYFVCALFVFWFLMVVTFSLDMVGYDRTSDLDLFVTRPGVRGFVRQVALERPDVITRLVLHASVGVLGRRP